MLLILTIRILVSLKLTESICYVKELKLRSWNTWLTRNRSLPNTREQQTILCWCSQRQVLCLPKEKWLKQFQSAYRENFQIYLQGSSTWEWIPIKVCVLPSPVVLSAAAHFYSHHLSQYTRLLLFYTQGVSSNKAETVGWVRLQTWGCVFCHNPHPNLHPSALTLLPLHLSISCGVFG